MNAETARLANLISASHRILLITGAGVSTGSGIPDYRGPNGVWQTQRPVEYGDFLASEDKRIEYWDQKLAAAPFILAAKPGRVHCASVDLERAGRLGAIVTQNIDGLHTEAGSSSSVVIEVHGTGREAACLGCGVRGPIEPMLELFASTRRAPRCSQCGGLVKPATISFGQQLEPMTLARAAQAADRCDLVVALGSTLSVYPAAAIPLDAAHRGVPYVIVNRGRTDHDDLPAVTLRIEGDVEEVFAEAVADALSR
ncbi:MAG: Sir2 family NAD-dependent protein deacetylase [Acidimicrobiia bacterium]